MNREHPPGDDVASPSQLIEINRICDRFEDAWQAGSRPAIEDHLAEMTELARSDLLRELLATELELRRSAGERPAVAEYRARFSSHAALVEAAFGSTGLAGPSPSPSLDAGRNLLFGLLALQNNFIDRDALLAAFNAWLADKSRPLGTILRERGALDGPRHALLEALVDVHLNLHGGDPERSLAALDLGSSTRESLRNLGAPDLQASLAHAGSAPTQVNASHTFVGQSTSSGGRFRVLRPHARGGLGQVYVARDEELGRHVALKEILADNAGNPSLRSRFLLEAEINGNLEHPGIVPVYGLGTYEDGRPFYAMRFIQGDSLKEAIEAYHAAGPPLDAAASSLRLRQMLGRFVDVCDAIAYAHSRGVLHRDLKPANIMLGPYGETLIIDWGLAKAIGHRDPDSAGIETTLVPSSGDSHEPTLAGYALGSPPYMSPEQADGRLDRLGPATDVYGLGATLYALLTGKAPVSGTTAEEILPRVSQGAIVPPRRVNARVPRPLEAVCLKALALNPSHRYPSARAIADDVEHWLADEPVSALPEPLLDRARRWTRRHRTLVTTAAAVLFLGLIGLSAFAAVVGDKNRKLVTANEATKKAETLADARLDRAMASIEDYFTGFTEEALKGGQLPSSLRDRLLAKPREFYEQLTAELVAKPDPSERERALLAKGHYSLARLLAILGKNEDARTQAEAAVASLEALAAREPTVYEYQNELAMSHNIVGAVLAATGRHDAAADAYKKAISRYEALVARRPDVPDYQHGMAKSYARLGILFANLGRLDEAKAAHLKAISLLDALVARQPDIPEYQHVMASVHGSLGILFGQTARPAEAAGEYNSAVDILEALVARQPHVPDYENALATCYLNLGQLLYKSGRSDEAVSAYQKAIAIFEPLVARQPDVPAFPDGLAASENSLGIILAAKGRVDEAAVAHQRAMTIYEGLAARQPDVPKYQNGLVRSHNNLGIVLAAKSRSDEASSAYQKAITLGEALAARRPPLPEYQNDLANAYCKLGGLRKRQGKFVEAMKAFQRATTFAQPGSPAAARLPGLIRDTEKSLALANRLPAVLNGEDKPKDAGEWLAFAQLCYDLSRYTAATRFWGNAIAADPKLADDRRAQPRYNAACAAALAAAGKANDEPALDAAAKAELRDRAHDWLKAELVAWIKLLESGPPQARQVIQQTLAHWKADADLAGIRDDPELAKLPEAERKEWHALWAEVDALVKKAGGTSP